MVYLVEGLFRSERDDGRLSVQLLLGQFIEAGPGTLLRIDSDHAEALRLTIGAVLVEAHLNQIINSNPLDRVLYVTVRRPLKTISNQIKIIKPNKKKIPHPPPKTN